MGRPMSERCRTCCHYRRAPKGVDVFAAHHGGPELSVPALPQRYGQCTALDWTPPVHANQTACKKYHDVVWASCFGCVELTMDAILPVAKCKLFDVWLPRSKRCDECIAAEAAGEPNKCVQTRYP
jgi:hypothetical protein